MLIKLIQSGYLKLSKDNSKFSVFSSAKSRKLSINKKLPEKSNELEKVVHYYISRNPECSVGMVQRGVVAVPQLYKKKLIEKKLVRPNQFRTPSYIASTIIMTTLMITGVVKILIGLRLGKPVGILFAIMFILTLFYIFLLLPLPHRTSKANQLLDTLRSQNFELKSKVSDDLSPAMVCLGFALFGVGILRLGPMDEFRSMFGPESYLPAPSTGNGASGCDSGCGGGGCGGGGCGGGGCGGCGD